MQEVLAGEEKVTSETRRACLLPFTSLCQVSCFRGPVSSESPGGGAARRATWHVKGKNEGGWGKTSLPPSSAPIRRKNNFTWLRVPQGQDSRGSREWKSKKRPHNGLPPSAGLFTSK